MVATIQKIIGKVVPKKYAENSSDLLKKYSSSEKIPADEISPQSLSTHKIVYDSPTSALEPIYFFILDLMDDFELSPQKIVDNFTTTPGSGHFSELGQKKSAMQQQATKILGDINTVLKSILNLIYDLREFKLRIANYDDLLDPKNKEAALLSLKQIWLDKVDITKGNSSIKAMALGQAGFQTLLDAFLVTKNPEHAKTLDLNDRVKRIVTSRIAEFNDWVKMSEKELRKRFNLEKSYLKSQVSSLKLYSKWAKPYLQAAEELAMTESKSAALVKTFSTILMQLTLFGKLKLNIDDAIKEGMLPMEAKKIRTRDYYICSVVDFVFRGMPQKVREPGHYSFGGRVEIIFSSYVLSDNEISIVEKELEESDVYDSLKLIQGATEESIGEIQADINEFLEPDKKEEKKKPKDQSNPIWALLGFYNDEPKDSEKNEKNKKEKPVPKENYIEINYLRPLAEEKAKVITFSLFDTYKKAHDMASYT